MKQPKPTVLIHVLELLPSGGMCGRVYGHPGTTPSRPEDGDVVCTTRVTCRRRGFIYTRNTRYAPISDVLYTTS